MTAVGDILLALLEHAGDGGTLPELLCQDAQRRLPVTQVGLCVMNDAGAIELSVGSDERAQELESLQFALGEGPCMDAFRSGGPALYPDLHARGAERWPAYAAAVHELGVGAAFSFPLTVGSISLGVLDLFNDQPAKLSEGDLAQALSYVDAAVLILLHLQAIGSSDPLAGLSTAAEPLEGAFHGHAEIHQATGMVAVQASVSLTSALVLLRAHAYGTGRSLADVAREVLLGKLDFR